MSHPKTTNASAVIAKVDEAARIGVARQVVGTFRHGSSVAELHGRRSRIVGPSAEPRFAYPATASPATPCGRAPDTARRSCGYRPGPLVAARGRSEREWVGEHAGAGARVPRATRQNSTASICTCSPPVPETYVPPAVPSRLERERLTVGRRPLRDEVGDQPTVVLGRQHHRLPGGRVRCRPGASTRHA